mmetsp:Transcript_57419/g.186196  ORF Transcript_57419/g.186196 Transcript_57419/m.186196 type:complete len:465 (+) Transcript_57419:431-1825(+)
MKSIQPIAGMLVIMAAILFGFMHSFWAMDLDAASDVIFYNVATLLMTGESFVDGGAMADMPTDRRFLMIVLTLGALFLFLACALNIFIAVLGECYDLEQERMVTSFQVERARICSTLLLGPKVPNHIGLLQTHLGLALLVGVFGMIWLVACLLTFADLTAGAAASVTTLAGSVLLLQALMRGAYTQGWDQRYLWLCAEQSIEEHSQWLSTQEDLDTLDGQGRSVRIKRYMFDSARSTHAENHAISRHCENLADSFKTLQSTVTSRLSDVQDRQDKLDKSCENMQSNIKDILQLVSNMSPQRPGAMTSAAFAPKQILKAAPLPSVGSPSPTPTKRTVSGVPSGYQPQSEPPADDSALDSPGDGSRQALCIQGCVGMYSVINGDYLPVGRLHANRPCWACGLYYLFHSGRSRWIISKIVGDVSSCYAFVHDDGRDCPSKCRGPWMRCDEKGAWISDPSLKCVEELR